MLSTFKYKARNIICLEEKQRSNGLLCYLKYWITINQFNAECDKNLRVSFFFLFSFWTFGFLGDKQCYFGKFETCNEAKTTNDDNREKAMILSLRPTKSIYSTGFSSGAASIPAC